MPHYLKAHVENWDVKYLNAKRVFKSRDLLPVHLPLQIDLLMDLVFCLPAQLFQFQIYSLLLLKGIQP